MITTTSAELFSQNRSILTTKSLLYRSLAISGRRYAHPAEITQPADTAECLLGRRRWRFRGIGLPAAKRHLHGTRTSALPADVKNSIALYPLLAETVP